MEPSLVEGVTYILSNFFCSGQRVHNRRRPSRAGAKWIDAGAFS
jgi:hypothetical protein